MLVLTATGCGGKDADNDSTDSSAHDSASHTASASSEMSIVLAPDLHTDEEAALLGCLPS
jgi:hypothetical protein